MQAAAITLVPANIQNRRVYLTVMRPEPPHEYALPGGMIEPGETPTAAAARELREETGIRARAIAPLTMNRYGARPIAVFVVPQHTGRAHAAEGWPVRWMTWTQLRGQAKKFGAFLDGIELAVRRRYGHSP